MLRHPLDLCYWCSSAMQPGLPEDADQLRALIATTRARTVAWSWRWPERRG
jgi:hypothetical protein